MLRLFDDDEWEDCYDLFKEQIVPLLDNNSGNIVEQAKILQHYFSTENWTKALEHIENLKKSIYDEQRRNNNY